MSRIVSTDDASRRLQFVWLGPVSSPWPFEARGQMWAVAGGCAAVSAPMVFLLVPTTLVSWLVLPPGLTRGVLAVLIGAGLGVLIARRLARVITPTTPLRHHLHQVLGELDTPRPDGPPVTYLVAAPSELFIERRAAHRQVQAVVVPEFLTAAADELLEV